MLRIDLLPSYVAQRRLTGQLLLTFGVLLAAIVGGLVSWDIAIQAQIPKIQQELDAANTEKTQVDSLNSQAAQATAAVAPIQSKLQFVKDIQNYNLAYIKLYQNIARYTTPSILYNSMTVSGTTMTIAAYTPSFADLGRYLQLMYTEPDVSTVSISAIPGYGSADPDVVTTQTVPTGVIGRLPGYPDPIVSFSVYRGHIVGVNGRTVPPPPSTSTFNLKRDGFPVTITLALKAPLSPPTVPGAGPSGPPPPGGG